MVEKSTVGSNSMHYIYPMRRLHRELWSIDQVVLEVIAEEAQNRVNSTKQADMNNAKVSQNQRLDGVMVCAISELGEVQKSKTVFGDEKTSQWPSTCG